ncbi:MAG: hypothetical protein RLZZ330_226 [Actinomycetota bacterium]|jgi:hypothetical protein
MLDSTLEPLFPCSGRTLAEVIHSTARREYDEHRELILQSTAAIILKVFNVTEDEWDQIVKADAVFRRTTRGTGPTSNLQQSFKQVCNSALMPGSHGEERVEQKLNELFKHVNMLRNSEMAKFDSRVADTFMQIEKVSFLNSMSELIHYIYKELDENRRERNSISTRMSRIRKIAEYVLEPDSRTARELGEENLETPGDAYGWLLKVANEFIKHKESLSKFAASYEKPWQEHGQMVIERNEKDIRQLYSRNSLRNVHLIEKLMTSKIEDSLTDSVSEPNFMTFSDRTLHRLENMPRKKFDFSQAMTGELKTGGDRYEAVFTLPDFVGDDLPEFQITLLEFLHNEYSGLDLSISTHFTPSPTVVMSFPKMELQEFTEIYRAAMSVLLRELRKRKNSN